MVRSYQACYANRVDSDAEDTHYVYDWRLEQEAKMREAKGRGMTDAQVIEFVNGCKQVCLRPVLRLF